jgi:hypothetical protein
MRKNEKRSQKDGIIQRNMTIISQIKTLGLSNLIKLKKLSLIKNKSINHKYLIKTGKN